MTTALIRRFRDLVYEGIDAGLPEDEALDVVRDCYAFDREMKDEERRVQEELGRGVPERKEP